MSNKRYEMIYADPPWQYDFSVSDSRKIENQYPTMSVSEIMALAPKVQALAEDNCVLFLWATAPKLIEAIQVLIAWQFKYKSHAIWDKGRTGMGYWFRSRHELLLVATRGKFSPPLEGDRIESIIYELRDEVHSRKPVDVRRHLEAAYPLVTRRLEMFARQAPPGWDVWGNQAPGGITL